MANEDLVNVQTFCYICKTEIPDGHLYPKKLTCSDACQALRVRLLRKRVDERECRFCHKASTPTQRRAFTRFRKWEREHPDIAYPEAWAIVQAGGMELAQFGQAIAEAARRDIPMDAPEWWGSAKTTISKSERRYIDKPTPELDRAIEILKAHTVRRAEEQAEAKIRAKAEDDEAWANEA